MVQTWPAARNPWTTQLSDDSRPPLRRHEHVRNQQREIFDAIVIGLPRGHGVGGRRGFKTDCKEYDLAFGIRLREFQRVERRVDNADVGAFGFGIK